MLRTRLHILWVMVVLGALSSPASQAQQSAETPVTTLKTTVRRVVVDVVVTGRDGKPVAGLTKKDFSIFDNNAQQQALSFESFGFTPEMDYLPPKLPPEPPNTFVNLPATPEKGPLYVLLYDLVNMEKNEDQMFARQQLVKFINSKPDGTRFAIFVLSDGLHLVQGFTSDKQLLTAAIDPHRSRPHMPMVFLMGANFGRGDAGTSTWMLGTLANFLQGLPGRKNIIWFSGDFPLALFPDEKQNLQYANVVKHMLDELARDQIAIYPVDARALTTEQAHAPGGSLGGGNGVSSDGRDRGLGGGSGSSNTPSASPAAAGTISASAGNVGVNLLSQSYMTEDEIAKTTGGRAFYSTNDLTSALTRATEDGESYYSLSYAPSDYEYNGKLHTIRVELAQKGYSLAYRRAYYALDPDAPPPKATEPLVLPPEEQTQQRLANDTLSANMEHGAPMAHSLIFGAHIEPSGAPSMATAAQMAKLAAATYFFRTHKKNAALKSLPPIKLQPYTIDYTIMAHQLQLAGANASPNLEIAAAAYDADGEMLNAIVSEAGLDTPAAAAPGTLPVQRKSYKVEQVLFAPLNAATIRVAVRDTNTGRIGAMEINLPLVPEPASHAAQITR